MDEPLKRAAGEAARYLDTLREERVNGPARPADLRRHLEAAYRFDRPKGLAAVLDDVAGMLRRGTVHAAHPAYFGFFQPGALRSSVAASTLVAAYDPQASTYAHGAAAIEMEQHVLRFLTRALGRDPSQTAAHFTTGGQEANTEALVLALVRACPDFRDGGVRALPGEPVFYLSAEGHHGFDKAATVTGLGRASLRRVAVDAQLRMDVAALEAAIAEDRAAGRFPFLVVGTAGTTSSGAIDPLPAIADLCAREGLSFHGDAAWGGAVALSPRWRMLLAGIERADSIAFDAHKWLQMPLGTGMLFTRDDGAVLTAFDTASPYMPRAREGLVDPYRVSHAWSRRASGVPLFVALAELGHEGMAAMIDRMIELGALLRRELASHGFHLEHESPLPLVCFTHPRIEEGATTIGNVARALHQRGRAFVGPTELSTGRKVLRACITNARTEERDVAVLIEELSVAVG